MRVFVFAMAVFLAVPSLARKPFGTLTVVQATPTPGGPSPLSALTEADWRFVELVYAPLYSTTSKGITPWLASGFTTDDTGRTLTITLADNAQWSTGRDISPKDVVYTYELARQGKWNKAYVALLSPVKAVRAASNGLDVVFELSRPVANPKELLTVPLLPSGLHGPLDDPTKQRPLPLGVLGAGLYKLKVAQNSANLIHNEYCIRTPRISEVRFVSSGEPGISVDMVRLNGDTVTFDTTARSSTIASRELANGDLILPSYRVVMVAVGASQSGWTDPALSQVIRSIIPRQALFSATFPGQPATAPPAPGAREIEKLSTLPSVDVKAVRAQLEKQGWSQSFDSKVYTRKGPSGASERLELPLLVDADDNDLLRRASTLRQQFLAAGIDLRVDPRPRLELLSRLASREFPAALVSIHGDLVSLFHSKGAWNFSGYHDQKTDDAIGQKDWSAAANRIAEVAPSIVLGVIRRTARAGRNVMAPRVSGPGGFGEFYKWRIR